jgi:hypothetical protein
MRIRLMFSKIWHWPKRGFVMLGNDCWDNDFGVTFGWGFRENASEGEPSWRQVWSINIRWPVSVRHRVSIAKRSR